MRSNNRKRAALKKIKKEDLSELSLKERPTDEAIQSKLCFYNNFNLEEIQDKKVKLETLKKYININKEYKKFKYNDEIYSVGDNILICDYNSNHLIGKIMKINNFNGIRKDFYWPSIQINWYYKKEDIMELSKNIIGGINMDSISNYEVFNSNHSDFIFIETIISKCEVLSFKDYENLEEINSNVYFSRAFFDPIKVSF